MKLMTLKFKKLLNLVIFPVLAFINASNAQDNDSSKTLSRIDIKKDLLLGQFDCKTDVDDLHTVAAFVTLMSHPDFEHLNYHGVAGTYGVQDGLYVPPNELFELAFGNNWTDAHADFDAAVIKVTGLAVDQLNKGGDIWIAEAGQSDFSAALVRSIQKNLPDIDTAKHIHIVQHSNWNEEVTSVESLEFVKEQTNYHKIPDGNAVGNGTPGFRTPGYREWKNQLTEPQLIAIWNLAVELGLEYNGKDGRYNNAAIAAEGLDFSDLSETCWMLGLDHIKDTTEFFNRYGR